MGFITQNPVVGGMAAGFISGALKGNPKAMLTGAVIGGATAFVGGQVHAAFGIVGDVGMMGAGVGLSVAKGGPESLAYMAASFAGSMAGYYMTGQGGGRSAGASSGPSERDRDALLQNPYCEDPNFDEQFSEIQQRLTDLTSFVPAADVIIGIDSPVGGVNTTFPFQSGDNPSTNWTTWVSGQ